MTARQGVVAWFAATLIGGLWLGVIGRAVMVLIAIAAGQPPRWSWGGTVEVIVFGMLLAACAVPAWMALRHWLPALRMARGLPFGLILFGIFAVQPPPSAQSAVAGIGQRTLSLVLFGILLAGFGVLVETVLTRRLPPSRGPRE